MIMLFQDPEYSPNPKQLEYITPIAREISELHPAHPPAEFLAQHYRIYPLLAARDALRRGETVPIIT